MFQLNEKLDGSSFVMTIMKRIERNNKAIKICFFIAFGLLTKRYVTATGMKQYVLGWICVERSKKMHASKKMHEGKIFPDLILEVIDSRK